MFKKSAPGLLPVFASALVAASVAIAPTAGGVAPAFETDPYVEPIDTQFAGWLKTPSVSVTPTWNVQATFYPESVFVDSIIRADPIYVFPEFQKREIRVGVWDGQTCSNLQGPGRRTWSFVGQSGPLFEANLDFFADADVQIALARGSGRNQTFKIGDRICVVQTITWRIGPAATPGMGESVRISTSPAGVAPGPLVVGPQGGREYTGAMPAPVVSAINAVGDFEVSFPSVAQLRSRLVQDGYAPRLRSIELVVGRYRDGTCTTVGRREGSRGVYSLDERLTRYESSTSWSTQGSRSGVISLDVNRTYEFMDGETPCVYQIVRWTAPETGSNERVTYVSNIGVTPNAAPAPLEIDPDFDPGQVDPGDLDGPEVVLPDFEADDGPEFEFVGINAEEAQQAADNIRTQFQELEVLLDLVQVGTEADTQQGAGDVSDIAARIDRVRRNISNLRNIAAQPNADPQIGQQANAAQQQLDTLVSAVPIQVEGGSVAMGALGQSAGFNAAQSPVAGANGSGTIGALTLKVTAPKSVRGGMKATVRATVSPRNYKGVVRVSLVRNTPSGLKVVGARQVKVRNGKVATRINIPRRTAKGRYTLTATLVPNARTGSGITVQKPIRVN